MAVLRKDATTGSPGKVQPPKPLELGKEYNVFAFKQPKAVQQPGDEDLNIYLSFPSPTVLFQLQLPWVPLEAPTVCVTSLEAFEVRLNPCVYEIQQKFVQALVGKQILPAELTVQHRAIVVLEEVYEAYKDEKTDEYNELYLAGLLSPAYYATWPNPYAQLLFSADRNQQLQGAQRASFTDMYGNFIDLEDGKYVVLVFAVAVDEFGVSPAIKGVLSPPSAAFWWSPKKAAASPAAPKRGKKPRKKPGAGSSTQAKDR